mgnify:CR=1 FL=1
MTIYMVSFFTKALSQSLIELNILKLKNEDFSCYQHSEQKKGKFQIRDFGTNLPHTSPLFPEIGFDER